MSHRKHWISRLTGIFLFCMSFLVYYDAGAQETNASDMPDYIEMDIRTSRLDELADWCRRLGLSDAGGREDLAGRLREHYGIVSSSTESESSGERIITIESARSTEYFTLETVQESYARLIGSVLIIVKDGNTIHRLKADEILFNRSRNLLSASGSVEYTKEGNGVTETFKGDSLTIGLDDWEGVFMGGASERSLTDKVTAYRFAGEVISRDAEEVTVLKNAKITNATKDESYWSIDATKLWLLPSSDWAIANAVLKVGEVPLLYIPFMYLPGDEVVFHPVLGYRPREGSFVQTTTYLLGRPKASSSSENSITKILGSGADTERTQEGLFLRSTGKRVKNPEEASLSLLFDVYVNLGAYVGLNATIPKNGIVGKTDLSLGLGLTRDVYQPFASYYTPFQNNDGVSHWNTADLFGYTMPFRYRFKGAGSLKSSKFSLNWDFPLYSDPYVDRDFLNRSESMDWLTMIKEGSNQSQTQTTNQVSTLGSYQWQINTTFTGPLVSINPSILSLNVNSLSSSLYFNTRSVNNPSSPLDALFFYPERFTLFTTSLSVRGTLLGASNKPRPGLSESGSPGTTVLGEAPSATYFDNPITVPDSWSPWSAESDKRVLSPSSSPSKWEDPLRELAPPDIQQTFTVASGQNPVTLQLDYSFVPAISTELFFRSSLSHWPTKDSVRWDEVSSIFTNFKSDASLGTTLSDTLGMFSGTLKLTDQNALQLYNYINDESEEYDTKTEKDAALLRSYTGTYNNVTPDLTIKLSPFIEDAVWKHTSFQYSLRGIAVKTAFSGDADTGSWETTYGKWTKEFITNHQIQLNLSAITGTQAQTSSLFFDLPPRDSSLKSSTNLVFGISTTNVSFSVLDPFDNPVYKPISASEELRINPLFSLKQDLVYDPELRDITNWLSLAVFGPVTASYRAKRNVTANSLDPTSFSVAYIDTFKDTSVWKNRIAYNIDINTSLNADLQHYTNSIFTFSLGTTFKIAQFLDLSFSTKSQNSVVFRYVQNWPIWNESTVMPGEQNPLIDLLDSFRFDNETLRKKSGFKLKALSFKAVHYLGDWNATLGIDLNPYLNTNITPKRYQFNTSVSFLVQWVPISEFKTETYRDSKNGFIFK